MAVDTGVTVSTLLPCLVTAISLNDKVKGGRAAAATARCLFGFMCIGLSLL
jgi:hypothetical protein